MGLPTPSQVIRIRPSIALAIKCLINIRAGTRFVNRVIIVFHPSSSVKITHFPLLLPDIVNSFVIRGWVQLIVIGCGIGMVDLRFGRPKGRPVEGEGGFECTFTEKEKGKEEEQNEAKGGDCVTGFVRDGIAHLDLVDVVRDTFKYI
ncbi:hypothetical protein V6N12_004217 [Hibiscus sabdariffa]|uniref:Uncharacterized protein n=1 Tax=Hibiscus sabdariffa TaxID=183260 RepID=A0ABR2CKT9_9ROSI